VKENSELFFLPAYSPEKKIYEMAKKAGEYYAKFKGKLYAIKSQFRVYKGGW
jgi:hypothetical protein